ncbi:MAG: hypothetical protein GWP03_02955, partial [Proteobacteria bacterium]|nr:hypothetical protein [Pseudomonadota bacterium]
KSFFTFNVQLYRPFINLFNKLNFVFFHDIPFWWNFTNFIINLTNTILLFFLLKHFADREKSFWISLLFLTSFSHTEAVVWMSGRTSLLITTVFLGSALYFVKFIESEKRSLYIASLIIFFLGFFIKENIFVFPFLILLYLYIKKVGFKYSIPYFIILLFFLAIRTPFVLKLQSSTIAIKPGLNLIKNTIYLLSAPFIPLNYAHIENQFSILNVLEIIKHNPQILSLLLVPIFYIFTFIRDKKNFLIIFTVTIILSLPVLFLPGSGERYLYLPSIAILSLLGFTILSFKNSIRYPLILSLIIFFSIVTIKTTDKWNKASYVSKDITEQTMTISKQFNNKRNVFFMNLPDSYDGAYVFRNGIDVVMKYIAHSNVKVDKIRTQNSQIVVYSNGILKLLH